MEEHGATFAELLNQHMEAFHWGLDRLANASGIPKTTLAGWRSHRKLPRDWQSVVKVAAALGLDNVQTDELLAAARRPSLDKLNASLLAEEDRTLLSRWTSVPTMGETVPQQSSQPLAEEKAESEAWLRKNKPISLIVTIILVSISLPVLWQTRMLPSLSPQSSLASMNAAPAGAIRLVEQALGAHMHLELDGSQIITTGGAIQVGESVTISFVIRNDHTAPVGIL